MDTVCRLPTLEKLREYVKSVLCQRDRLDPEQAPLTESVVRRRGRACGLFFQLQGPRRVRTYAVWAGDEAESRLLFHDSTGARFAECRLVEGPDPRELDGAAPPARRVPGPPGHV
jgi:hypothetical protein